MSDSQYKFLSKVLGIILTLAAVYYLFSTLFEHKDFVVNKFQSNLFWLVFLVGSFLYAGTLLIIVYSWQIQLCHRYPDISFSRLFSIIGVSQMAKYLPGNFFHFAGRYYLAKKSGIKVADFTHSILVETGLIIISAGVVGSYYILNYKSTNNFLLLISVFVIFFGLILYLSNDIKLKKILLKGIDFRQIVTIFLLFVLSHVCVGIIVYLFGTLVLDIEISFLWLASVLAIAFIAGFVTPGSPGGIGIREFVFLQITVPVVREEVALSLIIFLRVLSIINDFILLIIAHRYR